MAPKTNKKFQKFGSRSVATAFGFFSAMTTAAIPFVASRSYGWLVIFRVLQVRVFVPFLCFRKICSVSNSGNIFELR